MAEGMYSENVTIGEPVSVYNSDEDKFFTAYPLLNNMNECVLLAQVDGEVVNLTTDMKWYENMGSKLGEGQYIIYVNAGKVYAENNEESVELEDTKYCIQNSDDEFISYSFSDKVNQMENNSSGDTEFDLYDDSVYDVATYGDVDDTDDDTLYGVVSGRCNITNFVKQGSYNLCWAASVATIVNYKKHKSFSAKHIANAMNISYDTGATLGQTLSAVRHYGLSYNSKERKITWSLIKKRITTNNRPFIVALSSSIGGHMITAYGYYSSSGLTKAVEYWDPNGAKGAFIYGEPVHLYGYEFQWVATVY